jgi:hypothetical protein
MSKPPIKVQRLVAVFLLGLFLLNYPLLPLFNGRGILFGIPALYAYLFLVWGVLIALLVAVVERRRPP